MAASFFVMSMTCSFAVGDGTPTLQGKYLCRVRLPCRTVKLRIIHQDYPLQ